MLSWHALIIFRIYVIEKSWILFLKMVKIFKDDENFFGEHDFPIQSSYTGQVQCLSHSRDQKFVTSLVQGAIY